MNMKLNDYFDDIARAIDPEAFSDKVTEYFSRAAREGGELSPEAYKWIPRIIDARKAASRVFDGPLRKPTSYMIEAAEALSLTHPDAKPVDFFNMMIFAERDLAQRRTAPGISLEDIEPEEYLSPKL